MFRIQFIISNVLLNCGSEEEKKSGSGWRKHNAAIILHDIWNIKSKVITAID